MAAVIIFYYCNIREEEPGFPLGKSHGESIKFPPLTSSDTGMGSLGVWGWIVGQGQGPEALWPGLEAEEQSWGQRWPRHSWLLCVHWNWRPKVALVPGGRVMLFICLSGPNRNILWLRRLRESFTQQICDNTQKCMVHPLTRKYKCLSVFTLSFPRFRRLPVCTISGQHCLLSRL